MERSDFIMATVRHALIAYQDKSFVVRLEILFCLLAVGAPDLPLSYSMAINCLKKLLFKFCFVEVGFSFCFLLFSSSNAGTRAPAPDRLVAGRLPAKIVN